MPLVESLEKSPDAPLDVAVGRHSSARRANLVDSFYILTGKLLCFVMGSIQLLHRHHASYHSVLRAIAHAHL